MSQNTANLSDLCESEKFTYLAQWREENGDYALAAAWLQQAVSLRLLAEEVEPLKIAGDFYNLGLLYLANDDDFNASRFLLKAYELQKKHLGSKHTDTLETLSALQLSHTQDFDAYEQSWQLLDPSSPGNLPPPLCPYFSERRRANRPAC